MFVLPCHVDPKDLKPPVHKTMPHMEMEFSFHDCGFLIAYDYWKGPPKMDLTIWVLVDLETLGHGKSQFAVLLHREEAPRFSVLRFANVEKVDLTTPIGESNAHLLTLPQWPR